MSDRWWEKYERRQVGDEWHVLYDGEVIATFRGEDAERNSDFFHEGQLDPRNNQFTEGFLANLQIAGRQHSELMAAITWLACEQAKLSEGSNSIAVDIIQEALAEGRRIVQEAKP